MIEISIPGRAVICAEHLVLDVNGTLTTDGALIPGVAERIEELKPLLTITIATADTLGAAGPVARALGVEMVTVSGTDGGSAKLRLVHARGPASVIAIGNGENDALMLESAALGIAVLQAEGAAASALRRADIVFASITDALDALLHPSRLVATLRA